MRWFYNWKMCLSLTVKEEIDCICIFIFKIKYRFMNYNSFNREKVFTIKSLLLYLVSNWPINPEGLIPNCF